MLKVDLCKSCGLAVGPTRAEFSDYCSEDCLEGAVSWLTDRVAELEAALKQPIDVDLYGYERSRLVVNPPPSDEMTVAGVRLLRVVLTPEKPLMTLELPGGRQVNVKAWAHLAEVDG